MEYKCCICKQKITAEDKMMNSHNPCALTLTTNFNGNEMEQKEQTFFVTLSALRNFIMTIQLFILRI